MLVLKELAQEIIRLMQAWDHTHVYSKAPYDNDAPEPYAKASTALDMIDDEAIAMAEESHLLSFKSVCPKHRV